MRDIPKLIGKALLAVLQGIAIVVFGIPFFIVTSLVPKWAWKWMVSIGAALLIWRYFYPRHNPLVDARWAWHHIVGLTLNLYGSRAKASVWFSNDTHRAFLTLLGGAIAFIVKLLKDRSKEKRAVADKFDKYRPDITTVFTLSDDSGTVCSLINIGPGTAMSVKFRFYVLDDIRQLEDELTEQVMIRSRKNVLLRDDRTRIWRIHEVREYPYILPFARQPKPVPLGIIPTEPSPEIRVEIEYVDTLGRSFFRYAHGGQSSDHELMSVGTWHQTVEDRTIYRQSDFRELLQIIKFYIGKVIRVSAPMIEADGRLKQQKIKQWLARQDRHKPKKGTDQQ